MNNDTRIELSDTEQDVVIKMAEGNPGALSVIMDILMGATSRIDPDNTLEGIGTILHLDQFGIYGPRIWMLYKDVCNQDMVATIGVIRACQLGLIDLDTLNHAIDNYGSGLDVQETLTALKQELPNFKLEESAYAT